jgi:hypothetical protein
MYRADILLLMAFVNLILTNVLLFNYLRLKARANNNKLDCRTIKKMFSTQKIYVMIVCCCMSTVTFIHFFVKIRNQYLYQQIEVLEIALRYCGVYTMTYFVFRKASKPIKNKWNWINYGIRPLVIISFLINLITIVYLEMEYSSYFKA